MEVCPNTILNSDASENVAYNEPGFTCIYKKEQLSTILIFVRSATGMMILNLF